MSDFYAKTTNEVEHAYMKKFVCGIWCLLLLNYLISGRTTYWVQHYFAVHVKETKGCKMNLFTVPWEEVIDWENTFENYARDGVDVIYHIKSGRTQVGLIANRVLITILRENS